MPYFLSNYNGPRTEGLIFVGKGGGRGLIIGGLTWELSCYLIFQFRICSQLWFFFLQIVNYGIAGHYEPHYDFARVRKILTASVKNLHNDNVCTRVLSAAC